MLPACDNVLMELDKVSVTFSTRAKRETLLDGIDLKIRSGELAVVIGDSGSGKSSLLNVMAGFIRRKPPWSRNSLAGILRAFESPLQNSSVGGRVLFDGIDKTHVQPRDRPVGLVMQRFNLYRHMTVRENLEFPMRMRGVPKARWNSLTGSVAERLRIEGLLAVKPDRLSGGQEQRVAIGKMLLRFPAVALLDEAFSNLDYDLRAELRRDVLQWFLKDSENAPAEQAERRAVVFVSHNLDDAIHADQIVLLKRSEEMARKREPSTIRVFRSSGGATGTSAWKQLHNSGEIKILKELAVAHRPEGNA